jgi:hypothetical protein
MAHNLCKVDGAMLDDPANEENMPFDYVANATAHLLNIVRANSQLRSSPLHAQLLSLMEFWNAAPEGREKGRAVDAFVDLAYFGTVGKALWYLRGKNDPQLQRELERLATVPGALIGNQYLFYIAGTLAAKGYDVSFVPEKGKQGKKTPDLRASKNGKTVWIEANAKQPKRLIDTPAKLWQLIRDIINEKKQKFADPTYWPGLITADISPAQHLVNENGTIPRLKLREDLCRPLGASLADGFIYPLYADDEWHTQPENQGNVFAYAVDEFSRIDRAKYGVTQCLITITRRVWHDGHQLALPKGHQLLVHRLSEADALLELSRHIYMVDSKTDDESVDRA